MYFFSTDPEPDGLMSMIYKYKQNPEKVLEKVPYISKMELLGKVAKQHILYSVWKYDEEIKIN